MSIKWTKELLEEVRNERGIVFGKMSVEAQEAIVYSVDTIPDIYLNDWVSVGMFKLKPHVGFRRHMAYRLPPSYTPPELKKKGRCPE